MMQLNVPFIPDNHYNRFLNGLGSRLYAVHFSLYDSALCDARIRFETLEIDTLVNALKRVLLPKKYLLANGRFHPTDQYESRQRLNELLQRLERLQAEGVLDGIIFSDFYLLFALSDAAPDIVSGIEAVPSINFMIDSAPRLDAVLEMIGHTRFQAPGKISVDRGLNRRLKMLSELSTAIRNRLPDAKIELLANEGCLSHCSFRPTHDALIAAANAGFGLNTLRMNRDLGCMRILSETPHRLLASPFIRPEDVSRYEDLANVIKICGRTLGSKFLKYAVSAYTKGVYKGNLLNLLDAAHWMAEKWSIQNQMLPSEIFDTLTTCEQHCAQCLACRELFQKHARQLTFRMRDLRSNQA